MMCYRDRTFCPFSECKKLRACGTALTEEIKEQAKKAGLYTSQ